MAEHMYEVVAVDPALNQAASNVTGEYNFHLTNENGVYHSTKIDQLAVSKELEAQIKTVVNGNPPNYHYLPEIVGKVSGKFAYDADTNILTLNTANIVEGDNLVDNPSDEGAQYSFEIYINYNKTFGILNYDNIKLKILEFTKMGGEFEPINDDQLRTDVKDLLDKNNKDRNDAEIVELVVDRNKFKKNNAVATKIESVYRGFLGRKAAKKQGNIRNKLLSNLQPAAKALIELLDSTLKTKSDAAEGDEPMVEGTDGEYVPGPNSDSTKYVAWLNTQPNISKDQYNALKDRWNYLRLQPNPDDIQELRNIERLNKTLRVKRRDVVELKNGPNYIEWTQDQDLKNGGKRRTLKRGGKKSRRKAKRSQRRRSGRREKRTSRR